jgi:hypothetical protein
MTTSRKSHLLTAIFLFPLISLFHFASLAQDPSTSSSPNSVKWKDKIFYGGSLGLQFGNVTLVDISPLIGYKITPRIGIGVSPTYKYYQFKNYYGQSYDLKSHVWGGGLFGRVLVFDRVFAHAEYEYLTYKSKDNSSSASYINEYNSVLVGAGYREPISQNGYMYLLLLWNLNETIDSPYNNPIIRAGFTIGF